jgi:hypothetical protein
MQGILMIAGKRVVSIEGLRRRRRHRNTIEVPRDPQWHMNTVLYSIG